MFVRCSYFLGNLSLNVLINMVLTRKKECSNNGFHLTPKQELETKNSNKKVHGINVRQFGGNVDTNDVQSLYLEGPLTEETARAAAILNQSPRGSINVEQHGGHIGHQRVSEVAIISK